MTNPQVNKSYNSLETVLKKDKPANRNKITVDYVNFFSGRLSAIRQKPTVFKINNWRPNFCDWRKTSWRRQIITTLTSQSITPPADQVKCQKYIILCRRTIIYDLQLLRKINNRDMTLHCAFVLACGLNVVIGVVNRAMTTANKTWTITHPLDESHFDIHAANCSSKFSL